MAMRFDGELGLPMEPRFQGLFLSDDEKSALFSEWTADDLRKLLMLCDYFNIPAGPQQFLILSLRLAQEVVPCFREKQKEGRPGKWNSYTLGVLAVEIERLVADGNTQSRAAKILAKNAPWTSFIESWDEARSITGGDPAEAILAAYKKAKKDKFTPIARKAFLYHEATNTISAWDSSILTEITPP